MDDPDLKDSVHDAPNLGNRAPLVLVLVVQRVEPLLDFKRFNVLRNQCAPFCNQYWDSRSCGAQSVAKIIPFRKPRRLTPEIVCELIRIHSSCVHAQEHRCPLLISVRSLTWELNCAANIGDEEDKGFRRTDPMCAARPLDFEEGE